MTTDDEHQPEPPAMKASPEPSAPPPIDDAAEYKTAWVYVGAVLVTLTLVKPLGGIAVVGTIAFTFAAILQLYLPLHRSGKLDRDYDWVGLHLRAWRKDLKIVLILCAITFPPFIIGHHLYMENIHGWVEALGLEELARFIPQRRFAPEAPESLTQWATKGWWLLSITATHTLGVALPEETFYRGYLQPQFERRWKPVRKIFGVPLGRAALLAAALFALGHFLGEWNPLRLGPFFPALVFAWQRNASGSIAGAITYHAACNILGEVLFSLYKPV